MAEEYMNDWSSGDESESELCNNSNLDTQPARHIRTPQQRSQLRPAKNTLPFVPYADWIPDQIYVEQPPTCIHYVLEWKFTFNNRSIAKQTEEDLVLAPGDFWKEELLLKIEEIAKTTSKPCKADSTMIVMSVNDRSESDITKRFKELQINWSIVERQLQAWSHLLRIGKRLKVTISFKYAESNKAPRATGRGATAVQLADRDLRLDAEQATLDGPASWRHVYGILRCPGPPCDRGPYCWQDPEGKRHYKLLGHQLRSLVKFVQGGGKLETHNDMPQEIRTQLYAEEQQHSNRKRKRQDSQFHPAGHPPPVIINNNIPAHPGQTVADNSVRSVAELSDASSRSSSFSIPGLRDDAVYAYCEWHCSKVRGTEQKRHYELARDLTLERGLDLELVHEDNDARFFVEGGVLEGVARRFVKDIEAFLDQYITL